MRCRGKSLQRAAAVVIGSTLVNVLACRLPTDVLQGYVEADYIDISSPLGGTLETLQVQRGQNVASGSPLFALERKSEEYALSEAESRLLQAQARLADLKKGQRPSELAALEARAGEAAAQLSFANDEYKRSEELYRKRTISIEERDRAQTLRIQREHELQDARSQLQTAGLGARSDVVSAQEAEVSALSEAVRRARWSVDQKFQKAPEAAEVAETYYEQGEYVPGSRPIVRLLAPGRIKYRFYVPEKLLSSLSAGTAVLVQADGADPVQAQVSFISPQAEFTPPVIFSRERRDKLVFLIEARPLEENRLRLRPGQPIEVRLKQDR